MTSRKALIPVAVFVMSAAVYTPARRAQDSQAAQPSLAEASRKAKQQQRTEPKGGKVFTDEDIASLKGGISVVGPEATAPPAEAATTPAPSGSKGAAEPAKGEAYWRKRFAEARRVLADDSKELDVLQREYNLKEVQFYSNPNVALREEYSRKDLNDTQAQINTKKQDVEKDNQAISDLQDQLRASGGEPGWANEDSQPASQTEPDSSQSPQPTPQASPSPAAAADASQNAQPDQSAARAPSQPQ